MRQGSSQRNTAGLGLAQRLMLDRFLDEGDLSRYGLMNATTSLVRDTTDPDLRWRLEELGGEVAAGMEPESNHKSITCGTRRISIPDFGPHCGHGKDTSST